MKQDGETKERLLEEAKKEFMEKGYMQSSLRSICKRAGVTTGALYFFFKDKEDVFAAIVREPLEQLRELLQAHYTKEQIELSRRGFSGEGSADDEEMALLTIEHLYQYKEEFLLVLTKSQGSRFENYYEEIVEATQKHYTLLVHRMSEMYDIPMLDEGWLHWFSHMQVDSFVYMITHGLPKEEAIKQVKIIMDFMVKGFSGIYSELL